MRQTSYGDDQGFKRAILELVGVRESVLDDALEWIVSNLEPDQVFEEAALQYWAEDNGYVKKWEE